MKPVMWVMFAYYIKSPTSIKVRQFLLVRALICACSQRETKAQEVKENYMGWRYYKTQVI